MNLSQPHPSIVAGKQGRRKAEGRGWGRRASSGAEGEGTDTVVFRC